MQPLTESKAWTYALLNVAATPGLGTLLARRFLSGTLQLVIAVAGCALFFYWLVQKLRLFYGQMMGSSLPLDAGDDVGKWGVGLFIIAWVWSSVSSIQLIAAAKRNSGQMPTPPPVVTKNS